MPLDEWWSSELGGSSKTDAATFFPAVEALNLPFAPFEEESHSHHTYELIPEQHPVRARMCGFGDRYRRPMTPPPVVRLVVKDRQTGRVIPAQELSEGFLIAAVDLWDAEGKHNMSAVSHSSIAATETRAHNESLSGTSTDTSQARPTEYSHINLPSSSSSTSVGRNDQGDSSRSGSLTLIGTTFVQASTIRYPGTELNTYFIFSDLSVRFDGVYRLRVRTFNLQNLNLDAEYPPKTPSAPAETSSAAQGTSEMEEDDQTTIAGFADDDDADTSGTRRALINDLLLERASTQVAIEKGDVKLELIRNPPDGLKDPQAVITGSADKLSSIIIPVVQAQEREQRRLIKERKSIETRDRTSSKESIVIDVGTLAQEIAKGTGEEGALSKTPAASKQPARRESRTESESQASSTGLAAPSQNVPRSRTSVLAEVMLDPFTVYSAKNFPGMIEPTPLTKAFVKQGTKGPGRQDDIDPESD